MKRIRSVSVSLTLMACLGMLFPPAALGASPVVKRQAQQALDISLHDGGLLVGQVVDAQGVAKESVEVSLIHNGRELAKTKTDDKGRFAVKGIQSGAYTLATAGSQLPVRAWSSQTAPPSSAIGAMLVSGTAVRGQCSCNNGGHAGASSYSSGGYSTGSYNGAASFNQGGGAASFNQGGGQVVSGGTYDGGAVTYGGDAGATYVDGSSGYYGGSTSGSVGAGTGTSYGGASYGGASYSGASYGSGYGGAGYGAGYGGSYAAGSTAGGGLLGGGGGLLGGGGGIFGGAGLLSSPWIIGAGVAAAVAIPVALDDDDAS